MVKLWVQNTGLLHLHSNTAALYQLGVCLYFWEFNISWLNGRCLLRPLWGRDNICVAAAGGKTPDLSSDRRTFADVMTENKLKATQVHECQADLLLK